MKNPFLTTNSLSSEIIAWNEEDIKLLKKNDKKLKKIKKSNFKKNKKNLKKIINQNKFKSLRKKFSRNRRISPELKYNVTQRSKKERQLSPRTIEKKYGQYKLTEKIDTINSEIKLNTKKNKEIKKLEKLHTILINKKIKQNLEEKNKIMIEKKKIELRNEQILKNAWKYPMNKKDIRDKIRKYNII